MRKQAAPRHKASFLHQKRFEEDITLAVIVLLCMPWMGLGAEGDARWTNGLYEAFVILVCFPIIVAFGAGSKVSGVKGQAVCQFLGDISYPLYVTHYPFIYFQMSFQAAHPDLPASIHVAASVSLFALVILVAYGAYRLYDLPVREWLKKKLFTPAAK